MTRNQILYQQHLETKRSNLAQEALTSLRDSRSYELGLGNLNEMSRHNQAFENETARHNRATEAQALETLGIQRQKVQVDAFNAETNRYNADTNRLNAQVYRDMQTTQQYDAETRRLSYGESVRHNKASESLGYGQLAESRRHNMASEGLQSQYQNEMIRHNRASEAVDFSNARARTQDAATNAKVARTQARRLKLDQQIGQSTIGVNDARKSQIEEQTKYYGQENLRAWIGTGTDVMNAGSSALRSFGSFANDISKSFRNIISMTGD